MIYYFAREKTHEVVVRVQRDLNFWRKNQHLFHFVIYINGLENS